MKGQILVVGNKSKWYIAQAEKIKEVYGSQVDIAASFEEGVKHIQSTQYATIIIDQIFQNETIGQKWYDNNATVELTKAIKASEHNSGARILKINTTQFVEIPQYGNMLAEGIEIVDKKPLAPLSEIVRQVV